MFETTEWSGPPHAASEPPKPVYLATERSVHGRGDGLGVASLTCGVLAGTMSFACLCLGLCARLLLGRFEPLDATSALGFLLACTAIGLARASFRRARRRRAGETGAAMFGMALGIGSLLALLLCTAPILFWVVWAFDLRVAG